MSAPSIKVNYVMVNAIKRYLRKEITIDEGAKEAGLSNATFWRYAQQPFKALCAAAAKTQYEAMTPEQRKLYDETVAKNIAFNKALAAMRIRNMLALKLLEEERERAVEQYIADRRVHDEKLAQNNKFGKVNLGERKCPVCDKTIFIQDKTAWLFKVRYGKGFIYCCSESCKEKKLQKRAKKGKKK